MSTSALTTPAATTDASLAGPILNQSPAAPGQAATLNYAPNLGEAIEAIHATIQLAARQGLSQARIALHPEELGEIRIHLSQTGDGLVARVTADTQAAAQALADGHTELRQSLSSAGLSLLHLDIGSAEQSGAQGGPGAEARNARSEQPRTPSRRVADTEALEGLEVSTGEEPAQQTPAISGSALIDVLA